MAFSCGTMAPVISRFYVLTVVDTACRSSRVDCVGGPTQEDEGERRVIFMPVFYCTLARESRMETICHPVGKAESARETEVQGVCVNFL